MSAKRDPNPKAKFDPILKRASNKAQRAKRVRTERKVALSTTLKRAKDLQTLAKKDPKTAPLPERTLKRNKLSADVIYRPEVLAEMTKLAAIGLPDSHIAAVLDISNERLHTDKKQYPEVYAAIAKGRAQGHAAVAGSLFNAAQAGSFPAQTYYLERIQKEVWKPDPIRIESSNTNFNVETKAAQVGKIRSFIPQAAPKPPADS